MSTGLSTENSMRGMFGCFKDFSTFFPSGSKVHDVLHETHITCLSSGGPEPCRISRTESASCNIVNRIKIDQNGHLDY